MSLLAPWFLAGLALLAGPIVVHLIRRATKERVTFSALQFLDESAPRLDRRNRIQHPWLLALRCLIVATLVLGFARPYLRLASEESPASREHRHVVAVLDESASMQRSGLWPAAQQRLRDLASTLEPNDGFVLLAAGLGVTELIHADTWSTTTPRDRAALLDTVLASRAPGWGPTPLDAAVEMALSRWEELEGEDDAPARRELVIVSDFAAGARLSSLASVYWPSTAQVILEAVQPTRSGNASLQWLGWASTADGAPVARLRISRSFDSSAPLYWQLHDITRSASVGAPETVDLLPGGSQVLTVPWPDSVTGALRAELSGDEHGFDNRIWLVRPETRQIQVYYVGPHRVDDPAQSSFYLSRALRGWQEPKAELVIGAPPFSSTSALIILDGPVDAATTAAVQAAVRAGTTAIVLLNTPELLAIVAALTGESDWRSVPPQREDALLGQLDFRHPLFAPFADPLYSDFTRVRFWRPQPFVVPADSTATIAARFDDGSAAVAEAQVGQGRVIVWGTSWSPSASQWVLSSKFVPWLQALAERTLGGAGRPTVVELGSSDAPGINQAQPTAPGVYSADNHAGQRQVAFNVPSSESRLEPIPLEVWEQLGVPLASRVDRGRPEHRKQQQPREAAAALENRQQAWRWFLIAAACLLILESAVAGLLSRGPRSGNPSADRQNDRAAASAARPA
jgi:hypothetical protein